MDAFFEQLKQRRVYRVAIGYGVAAWLVVQIAATVLPPLGAPPWLLKAVIVAAALLFPVALVLAWMFDLRSFHLRQATPARRRNVAVLAAAGLAVAAVAICLSWAVVVRRSDLAGSAANAKSVAVLPFASLSEQKENEYFAEGIQDEILTRLAKIADLKVISRTSTLRYKSAPSDLRTIARELRVANILEGSVQRSGDTVRVNVQLINATNDSHLWAELYDRKLTDIFSVESEIAANIADALHAKLSGIEQQEIAGRRPVNPAAYDAYLRGLAADARGLYSFEKLAQAAKHFEQATQLDPTFAPAWARLARADSFLFFRRQDTTQARRDAAAKSLAQAKRLAPNAPENLIAEAYYTYWVLRDYERARALFTEAGKRVPGASDVPFALASIARRQGHWDESIAQSIRAGELNPRDPMLLTERAWTLKMMRRFDEALAAYDRALDILQADPDLVASKAMIRQARGELDESRRLLEPLRANVTEGSVANAIVAQGFLERKPGDVIAVLTPLLQKQLDPLSKESYLIWLGLAQRMGGDAAANDAFATARNELEKHKAAEPENEDVAASLSQIYAILDDKEAALHEAQRAMQLRPAAADAVMGPGYEENLAMVQAQIGDADGAIANIERLLHTPEINGTSIVDAPLTPARLRLEPTWDAIRDDPRFQQLAR